jgi:hypothetical protein
VPEFRKRWREAGRGSVHGGMRGDRSERHLIGNVGCLGMEAKEKMKINVWFT